jgi:hypothetical protein
MKSLLPTANNWPLTIIPIRSAKISASSRWCVVKIIVFPSPLIFSRIYQIALLEYASIPEVGSSRKITFESPIKLIANDSFLIDPPERVLTN